MTTVTLGSTGITVDKNGFGALPIQRITKEEAAHLLRKAYEGGITFFDTARAYTDSEEKIGYALSDIRSHIYIATKTMSTTVDGFWKDLETSLRLLKTDHVDIYQFHNPDFCPKPGDGTGLYEAMLQAKAQGKIYHIGITNHRLAVAQEAGILALPGMELCTAEEAHVVCLFETLEGAMEFDRYIYDTMPHIPNKPEIFGEQRILDQSDQLAGTLEDLLLVSSFVAVDDVKRLAEAYGGTAFPAHVDRDSYSVTAALGSIPPEGGYTVAEVTREADLEALRAQYPELRSMGIVRDSDSHYLDTLAESPALKLPLPERTAKAVLEALRRGISSL